MNLTERRPEVTDSSTLFGAEAIRERASLCKIFGPFSRRLFRPRSADDPGVFGHLVISGMGKSGSVGRKMAATFASTGTPSFFVHPAGGGSRRPRNDRPKPRHAHQQQR